MMLAYHHGLWPSLAEIIERARREQDMGVVAMKTLKGAKHNGLVGFREEAGAYSQAALKWVLSNPDVSCAVISFFQLQHVDEYLFASGQQPTRRGCRDPREVRRADPRARTARRTAAPVSAAARRSCRSTTCSATACTSRTTAGRRRACGSTRSSRRTPRCARRAAPRVSAAVRSSIRIQERMTGAHELLSPS